MGQGRSFWLHAYGARMRTLHGRKPGASSATARASSGHGGGISSHTPPARVLGSAYSGSGKLPMG